MLQSPAVKSPFLLPLYLLSLFALFLLAFTALAMVGAWAPRSAETSESAAALVLERSALYAEACVPAALLPAVFFTALRVARNPVSRPFSLLLPASTAFLILLLGPAALGLLGSRVLPALPAVSPAGYLVPGALTAAESTSGAQAVVLVQRQYDGGRRLEDVVILRDSPADSRLLWYAEGRAEATDNGALLRLGSGAGATREGPPLEVRISGLPVAAQLILPAESTARLLEDLGFLNAELGRAGAESRLDSILLCAAIASFLCFSAVLLRMTRWPLLGIVLLGALWRGALVGFRFAGEQIRPAVAALLPGSAGFVARNSPALLMLALAGIALAVDLVFVAFDFWEREIAS